MPMLRSRRFNRYLYRVALVLAGAAACTGTHDATNLTTRPAEQRGYSRNDSAALSVIRRDVVGAASNATSDAGTSLVSLTPGDFQGYTQPETIVGVVSGPVRSVSVTGNGAIKCTGTYGTIIGYDALGVELGRQPLALIDPNDCSTPANPDDVTYGASGTLTVTNATIARFDITPMSPLEFPVFDLIGHASATYTIALGSAPSISVVCTPSSVVRASSTPVACSASASGGALVVTGWTFTPDDAQAGVVSSAQTSTFWTGMAVASGGVTVQGTVGGVVANSETGRITVAARHRMELE